MLRNTWSSSNAHTCQKKLAELVNKQNQGAATAHSCKLAVLVYKQKQGTATAHTCQTKLAELINNRNKEQQLLTLVSSLSCFTNRNKEQQLLTLAKKLAELFFHKQKQGVAMLTLAKRNLPSWLSNRISEKQGAATAHTCQRALPDHSCQKKPPTGLPPAAKSIVCSYLQKKPPTDLTKQRALPAHTCQKQLAQLVSMEMLELLQIIIPEWRISMPLMQGYHIETTFDHCLWPSSPGRNSQERLLCA